ncbi:MAG: HIT domain-containing protein [Paracoccaceae bacterium]
MPFNFVDMWYTNAEQPQYMSAMNHTHTKPEVGSKFHWLFLPGPKSTTALYDKIVEETRNFAVLPTKGSLVPGWLLIVPKFPTPRMADVPQNMSNELNDLLGRLTAKLENEFGTAYTFEHGGLKGSRVSCGVDQAHLHVAPLKFDLVNAAQSESPNGWFPVDPDRLLPTKAAGGEYWFASDGDSAICKMIDRPQSQFFRKIIAKESGNEELWDYREEDFIENVALTIDAMGANG